MLKGNGRGREGTRAMDASTAWRYDMPRVFVADAGSELGAGAIELAQRDLVARDERGDTYFVEAEGAPCALRLVRADESAAMAEAARLSEQASGGDVRTPRVLASGTFVLPGDGGVERYLYGFAAEYVEGFSLQERNSVPVVESQNDVPVTESHESEVADVPESPATPALDPKEGLRSQLARVEALRREGLNAARAQRVLDIYADCYAKAKDPDSGLDLSFALSWARLKLQRGDLVGCESLCQSLMEDERTRMGAREVLGACLVAAGRYAEAERILREAVRAYQLKPSADRQTAMGDLARAQLDLGACLFGMGTYKSAERVLDRALTALGQLDPEGPWAQDRVRCLGAWATCCLCLNRRDEAEHAYREAIEQERSLAETDRWAFLPRLVLSLCNLSSCLLSYGASREARDLLDEAGSLADELVWADHQAYLPYRAMVLGVRGRLLAAENDQEGARGELAEALECYEGLAGANRGAYLQRLAACRYNLSCCELALGHAEVAEELCEASVQEFEECYDQERTRRSRQLYAFSLRGLAAVSRVLHRTKRATELLRRAGAVSEGIL